MATEAHVPTDTSIVGIGGELQAGETARLVETKRPARVLLDLVLLGTDGIALMQTLPALADLPVTFLSAYGRGDTVARAP